MPIFVYPNRTNMTHFDLNSIIKEYNLDTAQVASVLYPDVKYPKLAINRVIRGEVSITVEQLENLAKFLGVPPSQLFTLGSWKDATKNGLLSFKKDNWLVTLSYNNTYLTVYKDNKAVYNSVFSIGEMSVKEFTDYLDNLISNL